MILMAREAPHRLWLCGVWDRGHIQEQTGHIRDQVEKPCGGSVSRQSSA